jgi:secreted PhoX family phosphatase
VATVREGATFATPALYGFNRSRQARRVARRLKANAASIARAAAQTSARRCNLIGPNVCEVTGVFLTPDEKTMFVGIQHPGEAPTWSSSRKMTAASSVAEPRTSRR